MTINSSTDSGIIISQIFTRKSSNTYSDVTRRPAKPLATSWNGRQQQTPRPPSSSQNYDNNKLTYSEREYFEKKIANLQAENELLLHKISVLENRTKPNNSNRNRILKCKLPYTPEYNRYIDISNSDTPLLSTQDSKCSIMYVEGSVLDAEEGVIAHAVAADLKCGAGVAKSIKQTFGAPSKPKSNLKPGDVVVLDSNNTKILNVVTKYKSEHKLHQNPNQFVKNFRTGLLGLRRYCKTNNIKQLAIPRIGSGCDQLKWNYVEHELYKVFHDIQVNLVIYSLPANQKPTRSPTSNREDPSEVNVSTSYAQDLIDLSFDIIITPTSTSSSIHTPIVITPRDNATPTPAPTQDTPSNISRSKTSPHQIDFNIESLLATCFCLEPSNCIHTTPKHPSNNCNINVVPNFPIPRVLIPQQ